MPVAAQPNGTLSIVERDWTAKVGEARFGLYQDSTFYCWGEGRHDSSRHTTFYFGKFTFRAGTRTVQKGAWTIFALGGIAIVFIFCCRKTKSAHQTKESTDR